MSGNVGTINIELKVNSNGQVAFRQLGSEAETAGQKGKKAFDDMGGAATGLTSLLKGVAVTAAGMFTVAAIKAFVTEVTMLNARAQTMGIVMETVGKNTGYSAQELAGYEAMLRKTGIAQIEARGVITKMMQANIDLTESQKLARIAQDAAVIGNLNSSEAFETLIHGIQSAQIDVLRTIGINVNFEQSYAKLAKQIGKTTADLSEQEKLQARLNVVMEAGGNIAGVYEASMGTAGKQLKSLERYHADLKITLGETFNEALIVAVGGYTKGLKGVSEEADILNKQEALKEWGRKGMIAIAYIADTALAAVRPFRLLSTTLGALVAEALLASEAIGHMFRGEFDAAKGSLAEMKGVGDKWVDDTASILTAQFGQVSGMVKEQLKLLDAETAKAKKLREEADKKGNPKNKISPTDSDPKTKAELKAAEEAARSRLAIADWENTEQFRLDMAADTWEKKLLADQAAREHALVAAEMQGYSDRNTALKAMHDDEEVMSGAAYDFYDRGLQDQRDEYADSLGDKDAADQWYGAEKEKLNKRLEKSEDDMWRKDKEIKEKKKIDEMHMLQNSENTFDMARGYSQEYLTYTKYDTQQLTEEWLKGENLKTAATKMAADKVVGFASNLSAQYFDKIIGMIGQQIGAWVGLGTSQASTDGSTWQQKLASAGGYLLGIGVSLAAAKGAAKTAGYADGGWLGANPGGGIINRGSGWRDDVFLGMSHGGSVANFGMGGEFVIEKETTAKNIDFLRWFNGQKRKVFADGGPVGDPGEIANAVNASGFATFWTEFAKSRNWKKAVYQAIIYYAGAFGSALTGKALGPDLFAEGGLIGRRNYGLGGPFDNVLTRGVDKINDVLDIDKISGGGMGGVLGGLWKSKFNEIYSGNFSKLLDAWLVPFYEDVFTPGKSVRFDEHPERQIEAAYKVFTNPDSWKKFQFGGQIPAYATGTPYVKEDGPAFIHRGERILDAESNRQLSNRPQNVMQVGSLMTFNGPFIGDKKALKGFALELGVIISDFVKTGQLQLVKQT